MITKLTPHRYFWIVLLVLLVACGKQTVVLPTQTSLPTATPLPPATFTSTVEAPTALPTFTTFPTPPAFPTLPNMPPPTVEPTSTPLPAVLPRFPLDGYVMTFIKDGDLYFQDGENTPVKLTHIGEKSYDPKFSDNWEVISFSPILSGDNQKVIFSQSDGNTYSINTDGAQKQAIITKDWFASFGSGAKIGILKFIANSHQLFLEMLLCESQESTSPCSTSIFLANSDTGEIKKLSELGITRYRHGVYENISVSPNGKMIAVGAMEGMKIFTLDGKIIRQNMLPFTASKSDTPFPSLFWFPDSSGLIVAIPDKIHPDPFYVGGAPAYSIWRYMLEDNNTVQIPFDPPVAGALEVSPDGNWIVYGGVSPAETELYLGNLADGSAKVFGNDLMRNFNWNSNSKYFIHGGSVVISFDKPPIYGGTDAMWVDSNHFIRFDIPENNPAIQQDRILMGEIKDDEVYYYELGLPYPGLISITPK